MDPVDPVGGFFTLLDKRVDQLEHAHHLEKEVERDGHYGVGLVKRVLVKSGERR
jgi:hypothetical protein